MFRCHRLRKNLGSALPLGQDLVCDVVTEKHLQVDEGLQTKQLASVHFITLNIVMPALAMAIEKGL